MAGDEALLKIVEEILPEGMRVLYQNRYEWNKSEIFSLSLNHRLVGWVMIDPDFQVCVYRDLGSRQWEPLANLNDQGSVEVIKEALRRIEWRTIEWRTIPNRTSS